MRKKIIIREANSEIHDGRGRKRKHLHINRNVEGAGDIHDRVKKTLEILKKDSGKKKKLKLKKTVKSNKSKKKDKSK
jgi:hypothetical protein